MGQSDEHPEGSGLDGRQCCDELGGSLYHTSAAMGGWHIYVGIHNVVFAHDARSRALDNIRVFIFCCLELASIRGILYQLWDHKSGRFLVQVHRTDHLHTRTLSSLSSVLYTNGRPLSLQNHIICGWHSAAISTALYFLGHCCCDVDSSF